MDYIKGISLFDSILNCKNTGKESERILVWLPVVAAARLSENNTNEKEKLMFWINGNY